MDRRSFFKLLGLGAGGVATKSYFVFGSGLWCPPNQIEISPAIRADLLDAISVATPKDTYFGQHYDIVILDDVVSGAITEHEFGMPFTPVDEETMGYWNSNTLTPKEAEDGNRDLAEWRERWGQ